MIKKVKNSLVLIILKWTARVLTVICIIIIVLFFFGENYNPSKLKLNEIILSVFFPLGIFTGLMIGIWKQRLGGYIATISFFCFYIAQFFISGNLPHGEFIVIFIIPALLNLFYALLLEKRLINIKNQNLKYGNKV